MDAGLKVPGTDLTCVYHETTTEEFKTGTRGGGRAMWTPALHDEELASFWLEDDGGRVFVNPAEGQVSVRGGREERTEGKRRGTRIIARYIAPGDVVRVRGVVATPKPGKKGKVRPGLELRGADGDPLIILWRKRGA